MRLTWQVCYTQGCSGIKSCRSGAPALLIAIVWSRWHFSTGNAYKVNMIAQALRNLSPHHLLYTLLTTDCGSWIMQNNNKFVHISRLTSKLQNNKIQVLIKILQQWEVTEFNTTQISIALWRRREQYLESKNHIRFQLFNYNIPVSARPSSRLNLATTATGRSLRNQHH